MKRGNLFDGVPRDLPEELIEVLGEDRGNVRIERIVSRGHASPPDFWYDQETVEWVVLLKGHAVLRIDGDEQTVDLRAGDWLEIPRHCRHRVDQTDADGDTVWLAIHVGD